MHRPPHRSTLILGALFAIVASSYSAPWVHASVYNGGGITSGIQSLAGIGGISASSDIRHVIVDVIVAILDVVTTIALLGFIVAGVYLIMSNGDEGQKDKAKKIIIYILVGILVVLFSRVIVVYVSTLFDSGSSSSSSSSFPFK